MQAGKLDQVIALYSLSETNDSGEVLKSYALANTVFGYVITHRGDEAFESARTNARETIRVLIRYGSDAVTTKWQISWMSQRYNILAVDRSNRRKGELWLTCEVVGAL